MSISINITDQVVEVYDNGQAAYISAYDTQDQTNAGATTANVMKFRTTDISRDISIASDTQITMAKVGVYNIQFSAQIYKSGGGTSLVDIWLRKNGSNVAQSNTEIQVIGNTGRTLAAWNFVVQASAGDYFELAWSSADTGVYLDAVGTQSNPTRPAIPSVILTVTQV